jgi:hypothetical protein
MEIIQKMKLRTLKSLFKKHNVFPSMQEEFIKNPCQICDMTKGKWLCIDRSKCVKNKVWKTIKVTVKD